jgi:hypothetical protein
MASKMGEMASREATEAGALKAVRPERGREGDMEGGGRSGGRVVVFSEKREKSVDIRGTIFRASVGNLGVWGYTRAGLR